ncbi:MAG: hypothetical protein CSA81_04210 [Acidobacteria bacterium]|nr:MAG: hypothetical protein CSA81_04210 [Acidobacteriota bacterium]
MKQTKNADEDQTKRHSLEKQSGSNDISQNRLMAKRYERLASLKANLPLYEADLNCSPESFRHLINYALALADISLHSVGVDKSLAINGLVNEAIEKQLGSNWELVEITDKKRLDYEGRYRVGQVDILDKACLLGYWRIKEIDGEEQERQVFFQIRAQASDEVDVTPVLFESEERRQRELNRRLALGSRSWKQSVPRDSSLGKWLIQLSGTESIGWIEGYNNLGFITKTIAQACEKHALTHLLLPIQRRDYGNPEAPLLFGDFVNISGGTFLWEGQGISRGELVQIRVRGQLIVEVKILPLRE